MMLSENEILYIKTLLKQENVKWESKSTLKDLYRHSKFTIRQLTKQMANIDNSHIFRKTGTIDKEQTLLMVYKAERLYHALGDAKKIFKLVAHLIFDQDKMDEIVGGLSACRADTSNDDFILRRVQLV
jgi:hypothetical protein